MNHRRRRRSRTNHHILLLTYWFTHSLNFRTSSFSSTSHSCPPILSWCIYLDMNIIYYGKLETACSTPPPGKRLSRGTERQTERHLSPRVVVFGETTRTWLHFVDKLSREDKRGEEGRGRRRTGKVWFTIFAYGSVLVMSSSQTRTTNTRGVPHKQQTKAFIEIITTTRRSSLSEQRRGTVIIELNSQKRRREETNAYFQS